MWGALYASPQWVTTAPLQNQQSTGMGEGKKRGRERNLNQILIFCSHLVSKMEIAAFKTIVLESTAPCFSKMIHASLT